MGIETRSRFNNYLAPGLFAVAKESYKRYPDGISDFYTTRTSKRAYEESGFVSGFGHLSKKPEGTAVTYDSRIQGPVKRWVHDTYALGCRISQEAIEDDQYGIMKQAMKDLGTSVAATRNLLGARMIINGTATTYHTGGDGLALFSASHELLNGGTYSNLGSAADPSETALEAAVKNFENITDDRGKMYDQKATAVWCGPQHEFAFTRILESALQSGDNHNDINALKKVRSLKLIVNPEITNHYWGLLSNKNAETGLIWFDRVKPAISRHGDPDTGDAKFIIRARFSNEFNDARQIYCIPDVE